MPSASCCLFRHMYSSTYDGRCRYVTLYNVFLASRLPCTPTSGPVWYRFRVDTSRQVDELLTVIHSLVINHGRNKIVFVYSLNDWRKRSGVVSGNDFHFKKAPVLRSTPLNTHCQFAQQVLNTHCQRDLVTPSQQK